MKTTNKFIKENKVIKCDISNLSITFRYLLLFISLILDKKVIKNLEKDNTKIQKTAKIGKFLGLTKLMCSNYTSQFRNH